MQPFDPWRLTTLILAATLLPGALCAAWGLRRSRRWLANLCVCMFAIASIDGNWSRLSQIATRSTFEVAVACIFGLLYLVNIWADPDWRRDQRPEGTDGPVKRTIGWLGRLWRRLRPTPFDESNHPKKDTP